MTFEEWFKKTYVDPGLHSPDDFPVIEYWTRKGWEACEKVKSNGTSSSA